MPMDTRELAFPKPVRKAKRKSVSISDKAHLAAVVALGCIICGSPAEAHHIRSGMGMAMRASHRQVIPLCPAHHRTGNYGEAFHSGPKIWQEKFGTERALLARVLEILSSAVQPTPKELAMRKVLAITHLIITLMVPLFGAKAAPVPPPILLAGESSAVGAATFGGAVGLGVMLTYLTATNVDPWTPIFSSVEYTYPGDTAPEYVPVTAHAAAYKAPPVALHTDHKPYHVMSRFGTDSIRTDG